MTQLHVRDLEEVRRLAKTIEEQVETGDPDDRLWNRSMYLTIAQAAGRILELLPQEGSRSVEPPV